MGTKLDSKASNTAERGTAAGKRAGAKTKTEAKRLTSDTGKQSQRELTRRGGPGRAGTSARSTSAGSSSRRTATRGRGHKASAGA